MRTGSRFRLGVACALAIAFRVSAQEGVAMWQLRSSAFPAGGAIPPRYSCDGEDVSPPLAWTDPPAAAKSFALVVDDPDAPDPAAPRMRWVHLVVYDLPATVRALPEALRSASELPAGARFGKNDWKKAAWGGPCPPIGRHRYVFTLYALDAVLGDRGALSKRELEAAMQGHVLARAELIGTYERNR